MKLTITILITLLAFTLRSASDNGILGHQLGYYECRKPKSINPQHIELKPGQLYFHFNTDKNPESLDEKVYR